MKGEFTTFELFGQKSLELITSTLALAGKGLNEDKYEVSNDNMKVWNQLKDGKAPPASIISLIIEDPRIWFP